MGKRLRKKIIKIPKAAELGPVKELEALQRKKEQEIKRQEEEKEKLKELENRRKKQQEEENLRKKIEEENREAKEKFLLEQKAIKEEKLKEIIVDVPEGYSRRELYTGQDVEHDGMIIKYNGEKPDEFIYKGDAPVIPEVQEEPQEQEEQEELEEPEFKVKQSDFQISLKELFKDIKMEEEDPDILIVNPPEEASLKPESEEAETIEEFNIRVRKKMIDRNKVIAPQAYKPKAKQQFKKNIDPEVKAKSIENSSLVNKNTSMTSRRRSNAPVSRANNRISTNRAL